MNGRANKPQCEECSHPISFHGTDFEACHALGCSCPGYVGPTYLGANTISLAEAAARTGRSEKWLREHVAGERMNVADLRVDRDARGKRRSPRGGDWRLLSDGVDRLMAEEVVAPSK